MAEQGDITDLKLDYIQRDLQVIKADVKDIKNDYVSRREFEAQGKEMESRVGDRLTARIGVTDSKVADIYKMVYWLIGLLLTATGASVFKLILK